MDKPYQRALHIFRRDLRLQDNTALMEALASAERVIPCFIFDKRQIEDNDYKSANCIQFMAHSLQELNETLKQKNSQLYTFYGIAEQVLEQLIREANVDAVFINRDYTPFSLKRDQRMEAICRAHGVNFHCFADALLHEPEDILKNDGNPYTVYTPYFNKASERPVRAPRKNNHDNYFQASIPFEDKSILTTLLQTNNPHLYVKGGRKEALSLLKAIQDLTNYQLTRDYPAVNGTSKLSAHNKFGTLSIREFYNAVLKIHGKQHTLIRELYWRDFFTQIAFYFPRVFTEAFQAKYNKIPWNNNEKYFRAWCEGRTGFPIVDAGMRQLNTTGYMHNRVRMIVASFLVKDLHIDWHWGEKYFAQKLVDYDPAVNNGNWQWAASTGCDAQPYFRIFNPWRQQEKFDADCLYIKEWIPELSAFTPKLIHHLHTTPHPRQTSLLDIDNAMHKVAVNVMTNYPKPIIDHGNQSKKMLMIYKSISGSR